MEVATGLCLALLITNGLTLYWALRTRVPFKSSKQLKALQRIIAAFEVEGQTVLHITKVNPDNVFLRGNR